MKSIDIKCIENITFSHKCGEGIEGNIKVGSERCNRYWSYLYFDISEISSYKEIEEATLVLFKVPINREFEKEMSYSKARYSIIPTLEYITKYNYCHSNNIMVDEKSMVDFSIKKNKSYVEVDITSIVNKWIQGRLDNKGIVIIEKYKSCLVEFYGCMRNNLGYPFLRIKYKECIPKPPCLDITGPVMNLPVEIRIERTTSK